MLHRQRGYGFLEQLLTAMIAMVVTAWTLPSMTRLLDDMQGERTARAVQAAISMTRSLAVYDGVPATVCPLGEDGRCNGRWNQGWSIFADPQRRARLDDPERVLRVFDPPPSSGSLTLRAFRTHRYFRMLPNGQTDWQNGRFVWCPASGHPARVREIVINVQGRARIRNHPTDDPLCAGTH